MNRSAICSAREEKENKFIAERELLLYNYFHFMAFHSNGKHLIVCFMIRILFVLRVRRIEQAKKPTQTEEAREQEKDEEIADES